MVEHVQIHLKSMLVRVQPATMVMIVHLILTNA